MFEKKKPQASPFGGSTEKAEPLELRGVKPAPVKPKDPSKIKEMLKEAVAKKKRLSPRSICGC